MTYLLGSKNERFGGTLEIFFLESWCLSWNGSTVCKIMWCIYELVVSTYMLQTSCKTP